MIFCAFSFNYAHATTTVTSGNLIVEDNVCIGIGCSEGEYSPTVTYFDTLRLKGPAPFINFWDTSNSGSFPTNDWWLGIKNNSTEPTFILKDSSADKDVLQVVAGNVNGVALGADSEVVADAISVGSSALQRRIVNVAEGTDSNDAITKSQLDAAIQTLNTRIDDLMSRL